MDPSEEVTIEFFLDAVVQEKHNREIYSLQFCPFLGYDHYFATVAFNNVCVYKIVSENQIDGNKVELVLAYEDQNPQETFYCLSFVRLHNKLTPSIAVGGKDAAIKVLDLMSYEMNSLLQGHGNCISDLKCHPIDQNLLFSASGQQL